MNWGDMFCCVRHLKALAFPILGHLYVILHYSSLKLEAGEKILQMLDFLNFKIMHLQV